MNLLEVTSKKNINIAGSLKELDPSQEILAHFRNFYISQSYDRVCWVSPKKLRAEGIHFG